MKEQGYSKISVTDQMTNGSYGLFFMTAAAGTMWWITSFIQEQKSACQ